MQLAALSERQLRILPVSEAARDALLATKGMARNALQRQFRYISSLLAEEDVAAVRAALAGELQPHGRDVAALHAAERWRDALLSTDEFPPAGFVESYPGSDLTHIRQLLQNARKELERDKPPRSARLLFRYLRKLSEPQD